MGRPSKYHTHVEPRLIEVEGWARDGLIDEQIAYNLGVALSTFMTYKNKFPELSEVLKKGKDVVDREVENALLQKALGITKTVMKPIKVREVSYNNGKRVREVETIEYAEEEIFIPPDTTAQIFWLKNRKPAEWRDKRETEISGKDGGPIRIDGGVDLSNLSTEELKQLETLLEKSTVEEDSLSRIG
ncbi:MAG: transposase [Bacillota bacterium]|nr:transposase [Bacillota bacterium]